MHGWPGLEGVRLQVHAHLRVAADHAVRDAVRGSLRVPGWRADLAQRCLMHFGGAMLVQTAAQCVQYDGPCVAPLSRLGDGDDSSVPTTHS